MGNLYWMDYFKNPIVVGILVSFISFFYLKWREYKSIQDGELDEANVTYPILLGIVTFIGLLFYNMRGDIQNIKFEVSDGIVTSHEVDFLHGGSIGESLPKIFINTK